ncbi:Small RNA degrading nuclease 2 [Tetrabaena socialis]|uniref:Small RNA degrading nuclease 2 n=1 Tax=Tetrabaena socialis TaxID=47790 RepID=A0A2J8A8P6_9CHLO|nr:Small RNA degrading nuclease 2 [Tetrabaena socialis]|eukprot:PNH08833.1 Small RNA degrading nuclease 2 [Tetrabaena socialis]
MAQPTVCYAVDVECVATGTDHNSRSVAQISVVDEHMNVLLNVYVQQQQPVVSYLSPLTGLTAAVLQQFGVPLPQALAAVRSVLPRHAVLIGQNIRQDVQWLGLQEGQDFDSMMDLQGLFRVWNDKDARKSMALFNYYRHTMQPDPRAMQAAHQALLAAPPPPSFAKRNTQFEGVCMGNRRTCTCGAPFFG